jgi:vacuolar-type H+-ATPase subunit E/Vma4
MGEDMLAVFCDITNELRHITEAVKEVSESIKEGNNNIFLLKKQVEMIADVFEHHGLNVNVSGSVETYK